MQSTFKTSLFAFLLACCMALLSCEPRSNQESSGNGLHDQAEGGRIGGPCENCDLMYMGMPAFTALGPRDTSLGWHEGARQLILGGQVWNKDSLQPASGILLYYWHTDDEGRYSPRDWMDQRALAHGHLRGWVKTDLMGRWAINTSRPAPYPDRDEPAHIHILIKEPDLDNEYYIDALVFSDDSLLTPAKRKALEGRGGNPILRIENAGRGQIAEHHIVLGRHIPGYPK